MRFLQADRLYFNNNVFSCAVVHLVHLDDETLSRKETSFITLISRMITQQILRKLSQCNYNVGISNVIKIRQHQRQRKVTYVSYQNITVVLRWIYVICWLGIVQASLLLISRIFRTSKVNFYIAFSGTLIGMDKYQHRFN